MVVLKNLLVVVSAVSMALAAPGCGTSGSPGRAQLAAGFQDPPPAARPWVYWFWLDGNLTKGGITADLEAMERVGIGGVLIMEVDQGAPAGPARFGSEPWRELFKHVCSEAARLGLEVNMNNDAGWNGSGGPYITPELSMQKVVWTETSLTGPQPYEGTLAAPQKMADYYRDIAVLAFPSPAGNARIDDIQAKAAFVTRHNLPAPATWPAWPADQIIAREGIVDLTARMDRDGRLTWDAPAGQWTIVRFGHTSTGAMNGPAAADVRGLECDKLSKAGAEAAFNGLMRKLVADVGPLAGKTLVSTHIDSWEIGSQNWTPRFREEFQQRRHYDPLPFLPVLTGRVVGSLEISERFLWDWRLTVSDLIVENYAGHFRELSHRHGLRLSIEAYDSVPVDEMAYGGRADEPMSEFWSWAKWATAYSCTEMASAAHVYGKPILGAEAFTANDAEKWYGHPAVIKDLGDWAFCEGINRFVFHRYAMQPWQDRRPGMSMGPWGLHYERTQTWWEQSSAWHMYLARCQFLLQQGRFVADVCYLAPEGGPRRFVAPHSRDFAKYNFDGCPAEVVLTRMSVKDGRLTLPDGMSYRLLVLPEAETMTPVLLRKIKELVEAGATVVGARPVRSPSLTDYPQCDAEVKRLADELWGDCDGRNVTEHRRGRGRVVQGKKPEEVLAAAGVPRDFAAQSVNVPNSVRYLHRTIGDTEVYFVANKNPQPEQAVCSFRVAGRRPELWWPDTGKIEPAVVYDAAEGCVRVPISFEPAGSVFVVFRPGAALEPDRVVSVSREGTPLLDTAWMPETAEAGDNHTRITNTFTMLAWVKPTGNTEILPEANDGIAGMGNQRNDVLYPAPGHEVWQPGHAGAGIAAGRNGVCVFEHSDDYFAPMLVHPAPLKDWTHVAVVYRDGQPTLYLNGRSVHTGLKSRRTVHPGVGVQHTRPIFPFDGQVSGLMQFDRALTPEELGAKMKTITPAPALNRMAGFRLERGEKGGYLAVAWQGGSYVLKTADGAIRRIEAPVIPKTVEIKGPWKLQFTPGWGAPQQVMLEELIPWNEHPEAGVKYFSGAATYCKTITVPGELIAKDRRLFLDLGRVEVMAEVRLNGKDLGILWKPPYNVEISDAAKAGENALEVKVVNLWPNRMIGDEMLPEDSERNPNGTLKTWPSWVQEGQPSPAGRYTFTSWRLWSKNDALLESGLLGPVRLVIATELVVP